MQIQYIRADKLDFDPRPQMGMVFAEGFSHYFHALSSDMSLWARVLSHPFDLQYFYVAVQGDKVMAMAACTDGISPIKFDKAICSQVFGFLRGRIAFHQLTKHLANHTFPFEFRAGMGRIELVATASASRGQGLAKHLLSYIIENTSYQEYVLEVVDDNTSAIKLYEKCGFEVVQKVQMPRAMRSKINAFLYMKHTKQTP